MLRRTLLFLSHRRWLRRSMEQSAVWRKLTRRFIAGTALEDGLAVIEQLASQNIFATLDHLGENVTSLDEAAESRNACLQALERIRCVRPPATVSVKLTQLGLDFSEETCRENAFALVKRAAEIGSRIEVDMESSTYTDRTLRMVMELHEEFSGHVRAVIQAYLYRSEDDVRLLSSRKIPVRLCKGAYDEPDSVAFRHKAEVDANYVKLLKLLLAEGTNPAIATHDAKIIRLAVNHIREQDVPANRFEFQMLYGIRRDLQRELVQEGFRLRLYVPYGKAWFPYFMRRLAERPANVLFLARNLLRQ